MTFRLYLPGTKWTRPLHPSRLLIAVLVVALAALALLRCRADTSVTATLPDYPVTINGRQWDNRSAAYPLLSYHGVTYLPAAAADCLGLRVDGTARTSLSVSVTAEAADYTPRTLESANPKRTSASVIKCPITVAGVPFDNAATLYPFLEYRGTVYLPLTEELCTGPLCVDYTWSRISGLSLRASGRLRAATDELPRFILHMCGTTEDGQAGTNSIEAADHSYDAGYRWLELDFSWTSDGELVCVHDWGNWWHRSGITSREAASFAEFQRREAANASCHSFTPELLDAWLKEHPEAKIVTDVKDDNVAAMQLLAERYPDLLDRLVVQIYSLDDYEPILELGYHSMILTMYRFSWADYHDLEQLADFIRDSRILAITMEAADHTKDVFDALVETGIPVYVHTLNEPLDQIKWLAGGAYGIYTDCGDVRGTPSE